MFFSEKLKLFLRKIFNMIQRIQTLYLVLALTCMVVFYFMPFGCIETQTENGITDVELGLLGADFLRVQETEHYSTLPLMIMISLVVLIIVLTIFLFKRRMIQIRLCVFNAILALGSSGLALFHLYHAAEKYGTDFSTNILVVLPIVAAILMFLALRGIAKDEALVRSIDRIR